MEIEHLPLPYRPCNGLGEFRLTGWEDIEELLEFRDSYRAENPGRQTLYVLDNVQQANYTNMHTLDSNGLQRATSDDMSAAAWELYQDNYELTPELFAKVVERNIQTLADETELPTNALLSPNLEEVELIECFRNLERVFPTPLLCATIATADPSMAVAAHANGYFSADLSPMQNYLLADKLRATFGLELFGLGSYLAAYVRDEPLSSDDAQHLVDSLKSLYWKPNDEDFDQWRDVAAGKRWFLLSYRGS